MTARAVGWLGGAVAILALHVAAASAVEIRVLSGPGTATTVSVAATPSVGIEDRTPGAKPSVAGAGPASTGETFTGELTIFLRGLSLARPAAIEVADPLVTDVRVFPEPDGASVTVFVRQPVTYSVSRPSATGDVRLELHGKARPLAITGIGPRGRPRVAAPKPTGEREVAVDAESLSYDRATNTLTARGGVTLTRGDATLTADEVVYDRTNGIAEARGHVVLTDPQATIGGDFAHLNLEDETGWVENSDATFNASNFLLRANRLEKIGGPHYSIANGIFTTCECGGIEKPSWSIEGQHTDVDLKGRGLVHEMTFRVKDVPVLWLPYGIFPANNERQSGLLIPRIGYSNRRGFQYEQPLYLALSKSSDATVAVDVETAARIGLIGEYRYMLSRQAHGAFTAAYFNENVRGRTTGVIAPNGLPETPPEDRFAFAGHHVQPFYGKSKFYLDLFAVSDDLFLREIDNFRSSVKNDVDLRSTRFTTSRTGVYKSWGEGLANVEAAYYQDLIDPHDLTLQKLPRLDLEHSMSVAGDRVVGRFAGQAIDYQREEGFDGVRGDLAPDLFLPFHLGRVLNGSIDGQVRETAYHLTDTSQVALAVPDPSTGLRATFIPIRDGKLPALKEDHTRELAEVDGRLGTGIERVFEFHHLGLDRLKHTIEPEVQYLFVPPLHREFDQNVTTIDCGRLPGGTPGRRCPTTLFSAGYLFDERDAVNQRNFVSYGLTTRLLGRAATPPAPPPGATPPPEEGAPEMTPLDPETLPQGFPVLPVTEPVGPPAPAAGGAPAAPAALPVPRELGRASILHGYDISRPLVGESHASDIDLGLRTTPLDWLAFSSNTTVSAERSAVRGVSIGVVGHELWQPASVLRNFQSPTTFGISYRFIENGVNQALASSAAQEALLGGAGVNELDGSAYIRLGSFVGFTFLSRYSFNDAPVVDNQGRGVLGANGTQLVTGPHFLERDYFLRLISRCNCWLIEAGVSDRFNPDERLFRVQLTLIGLGSFGQGPLNRNYVGFSALNQPGFSRPGIGPGVGRLY